MFLAPIAIGVGVIAIGLSSWDHPGDIESSAKDKRFYVIQRRSGSVVAFVLGARAIVGGVVQAIR